MKQTGPIRFDRLRETDSYYGPHRAERPSDLRGVAAVCPFCPGNEQLTGPLLAGDCGPHWATRVIANRYPAVVEPDGRHEVIVEVPEHAVRWTHVNRATIERILRMYRAREAAAYDEGYAFVAVFKNSGAMAGASLAHPHAQVVALRAVPRAVAARIGRLTPQCETCEAVRDGGARIVAVTGGVTTYVPNGSRMAFELRLADGTHAARFSDCSERTLGDLAAAVLDAHRRLSALLGEDMPFNMVVQSAPRDERALSLMHWELELIPRNESFGGFEVGTSAYLASRLPEDAAGLLRAADLTLHA